ncbi:Telomerase-binding protein EST1A [Fusarium oxysporum f. sp. cubense race 1]|uniref:Telomerase-binding protein EST1A n=1 Tax=Fusarium oxysporum f. sp. cubense (strain race 1) TaxID=1229664 RepID=N4UL19_FUSC1|nr:Telomerase-binding protein EST1A [Fusarium oxysporum f. sp. cubense race 1]
MAGIMDKRVCQPSKQPSSPPPAGLSHTGDEVKEHYDSESHKNRSDGRDMTPVTNYVHSVKKGNGTVCDCIIDGVQLGEIISFDSGVEGRCIDKGKGQCTVLLMSNDHVEVDENVKRTGKIYSISYEELGQKVDKILRVPTGDEGDFTINKPPSGKRCADTNDGNTGDQATSGTAVNTDRHTDGHQAKRRSLTPPDRAGRQPWISDDGVQQKPQSQGQVVSLSPPRQRLTKANRPTEAATQQPYRPSSNDDESTSKMMRQPETRPISQVQLVAETKGIYAGLVMVETKCIEVDNAQSSNTDANSKLNNEQWQALIALHRTLLHEHHDFFLASQHPSASPALQRHRLPASLEHMLTFIYLAYNMMALLYETVPAFEDTWIECLGDLGRYRMAMEDDDINVREIWTGVSRRWYSKSSDKSPTTGRLYHHLAILARPNALQQLYYYTKSLCVPIPFSSARESIMTVFDPVLNNNTARLAPVDAAFVRAHAILFSGKSRDQLQESEDSFIDSLDGHIGRVTKRWLESGYYIAIALSCSLLGYGAESNVLMRAMSKKPEETDVTMDGNTISEATPDETFKLALEFATRTISRVLYRWGDTNTLPFVHAILVFMNHMTQHPAAISHLEDAYPWKLTSIMLNTLLLSCEPGYEIRGHFHQPEKDQLPHPLPEDFAMRGLLYAEDYFPEKWFSNDKIDEDEKYFELPSVSEERKGRILSLGHRIASSGNWLLWNGETRQFEVPEKYDVKISLDSR